MQVARHDRVQALGVAHHARGHGVDQHLVGGDLGVAARDLGEDLVPQHHGVALGVRFGDAGQVPGRARAGELEGEAHDPLDAAPREDRGLDRDLPGQAAVHPAAGAGVLALAVLAHDDPVEIAFGNAGERALDPGQEARGADVGVLIEALADGEPQAPEGHVVGHPRVADRAEIDGVEAFQRLQPVLGHHAAVCAVIIGAPGEGFDREREPGRARLDGRQHLEPGRHHLGADAVAGNRRDPVFGHVRCPSPAAAPLRSRPGAGRSGPGASR